MAQNFQSILPDAECLYFPEFLSEHRQIFQQLLAENPWEQSQVFVFGKTHNEPRLSCLFGDLNYAYSGATRTAHSWETSPLLCEIRDQLTELVRNIRPDHPTFNAVLCNYYRDGNDKIGKHSDDETGLANNAFIGSVSLGETRFFDLQRKTDNEKTRLTLGSGDVVMMGENMQTLYTHAVPQQKWQYTTVNGKKKRTRQTGPRINLTFRCLN